MTWHVEFVRSARKELENLPAEMVRRIWTKILGLQENPRSPGSRKLVGEKDTYRLRIGKYRVIFQIDDVAKTVLVLRVRHRKDAYQ